MIRNLKVLLAAAMALAAIGAVSAGAAQAAEFHCSVANCRFTALPDGSGTTAHHVFIVENSTKSESVSFTCNELRGEGTSVPTTTSEVTLEAIKYETCKVNGTPGVVVDMNGCDYLFKAAGTVTIKCPEGKKIEVTVPGGCTFSIAAQGPLSTIGYTTIGTSPTREVTVTANVSPIAVTGNATCNSLINTGQTLTGTYTTGNTKVRGETQAGAIADAWFL
jgi:hypothetical protein